MPINPNLRSRAAIIGIGGFGLQSVLHLWSRLRFQQDQRLAQGKDLTGLPDLKNLVSYAVLFPDPLPGLDGTAKLQLLRPVDLGRGARYPDDHYVERILVDSGLLPGAAIESKKLGYLTESEYVGQQLFSKAVDTDGFFERIMDPLIVEPATEEVMFPEQNAPSQHTQRPALSQSTIMERRALARAIEAGVVDPTRLDRHGYRETLVMTSIYFICSLAEPLASTAVWPLVAAMRELMGSDRVAEVVLLAATGSFATGETRELEEASCYAATKELASLMRYSGARSPSPPVSPDDLFLKLTGSDQPKQLFDRCYILDQQKSNGALAESAHELVVLLGNAIEAFVAAGASMHLHSLLEADQEDLRKNGPFSALGAASDHVPVNGLRRTVIEDAYRRIVDTYVIHPQSSEDEGRSSLNWTLADLECDPDALVRGWVKARTDPEAFRVMGSPPLTSAVPSLVARLRRLWPFRRGRGAAESPPPQPVPRLVARRSFLLLAQTRQDLARARGLFSWGRELRRHLTNRTEELLPEFRQQFAEHLSFTNSCVVGTMRPEAQAYYWDQCQERWDERDLGKGRLETALVTVLEWAKERLVKSPSGQFEVSEALERLIAEVLAQQDSIDEAQRRQPAMGDQLAERFLELRDRQLRLIERRPHILSVAARLALIAFFFGSALFTLQIYAFHQPADPILFAFEAAGLALIAGGCTGIIGLTQRLRENRWRADAIQLELDRFSVAATDQLHQPVLGFYGWLSQGLQEIKRVFDLAVDELEEEIEQSAESQERELSIVPSHLRNAWGHQNEAILDLFRDELALRVGWSLEPKEDSLVADRPEAQSFESAWQQRPTKYLMDTLSMVFDSTTCMRNWRALLAQQQLQPDADASPPADPEKARADAADALEKEFSDTVRGFLRHKLSIPTPLFDRPEYNIERLITGGTEVPIDPQEFAGDLWARAQPALVYDSIQNLAEETINLSMGTVRDPAASPFMARAMHTRGIDVLASYDAFSLTLVRTVHRINFQGLVRNAERYERAYNKLDEVSDTVGLHKSTVS